MGEKSLTFVSEQQDKQARAGMEASYKSWLWHCGLLPVAEPTDVMSLEEPVWVGCNTLFYFTESGRTK